MATNQALLKLEEIAALRGCPKHRAAIDQTGPL